MIKMEVDSRLNSDKETKNLVQNLVKGVMTEVASIKDTYDKQIKKMAKDIKDASTDSAERANFLSRYVDDEILKVA